MTTMHDFMDLLSKTRGRPHKLGKHSRLPGYGRRNKARQDARMAFLRTYDDNPVNTMTRRERKEQREALARELISWSLQDGLNRI